MDVKDRNRITSWIEETMRELGFSQMTINLTGTNEKGEGFAADFIFAEVTDKDDKNKKVHLAIKMGKNSETLRDSLPTIREAYKRELFVYDKVFPAFRKFELARNISSTFDAYPKCYKTFLSDDMEALVFEDLKKAGFALHDKKNPMNLQHIQLVLKNYAKLHALSFALRDQNKKEFDELTRDYTSVMKTFVLQSPILGKSERVKETLRKGGREDLAARYEDEIKRGKETVVLEILGDVVQESVVTHGDCHNNNFLFHYKDNEEENPLSVAIIDWQISSLHSPALDVSCFLYLCSSGEYLSRLDELLKFYYNHLKIFSIELGSDVEKLFPYSTLVTHWKKYSPYAFVLVTSFLHMFFVEKEDAPAFEDVKERGDMERFIEAIELKDEDLYRQRLISVIDHHCNYILS